MANATTEQNAVSKNIKHVGVYIRKSRILAGESETETLNKHRTQLMTFVQENKMEYTLFEEVVSGTSDHRPEFLRMLELTALEVYQAIVVINWDRLTRNEVDGARLRKVLQDSETLVIQLDPFSVIDLNNENDQDRTSFMTFLASWEVRTIARRLRSGKTRGALAGKWVNPTIPFSYRRDKATGHLIIDEEQSKIFLRIVDLFLKGMQPNQICTKLNLEHVPSPRGGTWNDSQMRIMLVSEVYIGTAIYGKNKYLSGGARKEKARETWIIVPDAHPAIISKEIHNQIIELFRTRKRIQGTAQHGHFELSGLLKCSVCGATLQFAKTARGLWIRKCRIYDAFGTRCTATDRGVKVSLVTSALVDTLETHREELFNPSDSSQDVQDEAITKVKGLKKEIIRLDQGAERLLDLFEHGDISRVKYNERRNTREGERVELERQLSITQATANHTATTATQIEAIDHVIEAIRTNDGTPEKTKQVNLLLSDIIEKVVYHNDATNKSLEIHYNNNVI